MTFVEIVCTNGVDLRMVFGESLLKILANLGFVHLRLRGEIDGWEKLVENLFGRHGVPDDCKDIIAQLVEFVVAQVTKIVVVL